jgi:hypothetical protein
MTVVVIVIMAMVMVMVMTVPRATMVRAIGAAFWLKGFFHGVHNQVH